MKQVRIIDIPWDNADADSMGGELAKLEAVLTKVRSLHADHSWRPYNVGRLTGFLVEAYVDDETLEKLEELAR